MNRTVLSRLTPRITWCLVAATVAFLFLPVSASAAPGQPLFQNVKAPVETCALLDDPQVRGRMDGLLRKLLVACGREHELGMVRQEPGFVIPNNGLGADVQVNDSVGDGAAASTTQSETALAYNPNTGTICSGYNDAFHGITEGTGFTGFSRSTDGGATFTDQGALGVGSGGDPSIVWREVDGLFYFAALHSAGLGIWRSDDDCQTFVFVGNTHVGGGDDKELMAVDNNSGSSQYGRLYVVWTDFNAGGQIFSNYSDDGGATWSTPVQISAGGDNQGAWPVVAPNGDVFAGWVRWNPFPAGPIDIEIVRSTDGGDTWAFTAEPLTGAVNPRDSSATTNCGRPALNGNIRYLPSPQLAVGPDGALHVVYSYDQDGFDTGDAIDVFYRRSTDSGATWEAEIQLNDDGTTTDQYFPTLSVGPTNIVGTAWYDRRLDPGSNLMIDYFKRISFDGGLTFEPSERVSDVSTPVHLDPGLATCYHGDYDQQIQTASATLIQWSDDRNMQNGHNDPDVFFDQVAKPTDFLVLASPATQDVCAPDDAIYTIDVPQFEGFTEPVTLSLSGEPLGITGVFVANPVTPPDTSTLTLSGTGGVAAGSYDMTVTGTSAPSAIVHDDEINLMVFDQVPGAVTLVSPANGATAVPLQPTLSWSAATQAQTYNAELATDAGFTNIIFDATVEATSVVVAATLDPLTEYFWRVHGINVCGDGTTSSTFSFTTADIPPILLVDDDDNGPDVRSTYEDALNALNLPFDVWDTANSDNEPTAAELSPYNAVIWFTGDEFGGFAGPGATGEADLATWLDSGDNCLLMSSQDYHFDRGLTSFMTDYLGIDAITNDTDQNTATGAGVYAGLGPYTLSYPFTDFSDTIDTADGAATDAFTGDNGRAAVSTDTGTYQTTFMVFPWVAIPTDAEREETLLRFLSSCRGTGLPLFTDGFESGDTSAWN